MLKQWILLGLFTFCVYAADCGHEEYGSQILLVLFSQETNFFGEIVKYRGRCGSAYNEARLQEELLKAFDRAEGQEQPTYAFASMMIKYLDNALWTRAHKKDRSQSDTNLYKDKRKKLRCVYRRYAELKKQSEYSSNDMLTALFESEGFPVVSGPDIDSRVTRRESDGSLSTVSIGGSLDSGTDFG